MSAAPRLQLRDALRAMVPPWLADRGAAVFRRGFAFLWAFGAVLDGILEWLVQGLQAHLPGLGTPTALPYEGRARGIKRGIVESEASFAERLRAWLTRNREPGALKLKGHPHELLRQLRAYIGESVRVRTVDNSGNWFTIEADGAETSVSLPGSWNWDNGPSYFWARLWIIIYAPSSWAQWDAFWTSGDTPWGGFLEGDNYTLGQTTPFDVAEDIRALVKEWKPAHIVVPWIIVAFDSNSFNPTSAEPDGTWGNWTTGGPSPAVQSRLTTARYWEGVR